MEMYFFGKSFFWKILKVGNLGWLVCTYCLLKDDMPFVLGIYMIEVNDSIQKSGLFFQKAKKNWSHDFNPEVNEK